MKLKNHLEKIHKFIEPNDINWDFCYTYIFSKIGAIYGEWGKKFRYGSFNKEELENDIADAIFGIILLCEISNLKFEDMWKSAEGWGYCGGVNIEMFTPREYHTKPMSLMFVTNLIRFTQTYIKDCDLSAGKCFERIVNKLEKDNKE